MSIKIHSWIVNDLFIYVFTTNIDRLLTPYTNGQWPPIGRYKLTTTINRSKCTECTNVYTLCRTVASTNELAMRIHFRFDRSHEFVFYNSQSSMWIETKTKTRFFSCVCCVWINHSFRVSTYYHRREKIRQSMRFRFIFISVNLWSTITLNRRRNRSNEFFSHAN